MGFKFILLSIIFVNALIFSAYSQTDNLKADLSASADIVSRYIWRGSELSGSPCVQPFVTLEYGKIFGGFWGSAPMAGEIEADFLLGYSSDYFGLSVVDYFVTGDRDGSHKYFEWNKDKTFHDLSFEATFPGTEKIPFRALVAFNFYGADTLNSRYYEAAWMFGKDDFTGEIFIGGTDAAGWYGNYEGVVNTGISFTKELQITDKFNLPVFSKIIINPQKENIYFVFGITIK